MAKRHRLKPDRFKNKDDKGLLAFDPVRKNVFRWGLLAGGSGGLFMLQEHIIWQIAGMLLVVFIANHRIEKASRYIPRWQAAVLSFFGMLVSIMGVVVLGTLLIASVRAWGGG